MQYSIIIPHKDRLSLLKKLLNSIPQKEYLEILLIDDASDSGIQTELDKIVESRSNLKLIRNKDKEPKGAGWARNKGLENATGEYVLFADSDDFFSENAFDLIDKELSDSTSDWTIFKTESVDEKGNESDRTTYYNYLLSRAISFSKESEIAENPLVKKILLRIDPPWAKVFKRSFLQKNRIKFEEINFSNDVLFNTNVILKVDAISISRSVIYTVLDHDTSLIKTLTERSFDQRFNATLEFNKATQKAPLLQNANSITGGYIWQSKAFGLKKVIETLKISLKEKVPLFYPIHRYLISFVMRMFGASKNRARFYLVFGRF